MKNAILSERFPALSSLKSSHLLNFDHNSGRFAMQLWSRLDGVRDAGTGYKNRRQIDYIMRWNAGRHREHPWLLSLDATGESMWLGM